MRNAETDEIAATCRLVGVHMDSVARKATPFPPDMLDAGAQACANTTSAIATDDFPCARLPTCSRTTAPGSRACTRDDPGFFERLSHQQSPRIPVDRLLGLARAGQPDRRPAPGRGVRPSQRRQRGRAHRPQLPVGDPVRGRRAQGRAHHRRRPLRLRRRARRADAAQVGLVDNWLRHVQDVATSTAPTWAGSRRARAATTRLCELNVIEQVRNVCQTTIVAMPGRAARRSPCTAGSTACATACCATWA